MAVLRLIGASAASLLLAPAAAVAGPWEVGGTGVDSKRKLKAEVVLRRGGGSESWSRPILGYAFPVSPRFSMEVATGYGIADNAGLRRSGQRDLDVKGKWQLASSEDGSVAWLIEPKLAIPLGDDRAGIGRGRHAAELPARVSLQRDAITWTVELKYSQVLGGASQDRLLGGGVLLEYSPDPRWVVGADLYTDAAVADAGGHHHRASVGGKWRPDAHWELQGLLARSLDNQRGAPATTYKVVLEYKF